MFAPLTTEKVVIAFRLAGDCMVAGVDREISAEITFDVHRFGGNRDYILRERDAREAAAKRELLRTCGREAQFLEVRKAA